VWAQCGSPWKSSHWFQQTRDFLYNEKMVTKENKKSCWTLSFFKQQPNTITIALWIASGAVALLFVPWHCALCCGCSIAALEAALHLIHVFLCHRIACLAMALHANCILFMLLLWQLHFVSPRWVSLHDAALATHVVHCTAAFSFIPWKCNCIASHTMAFFFMTWCWQVMVLCFSSCHTIGNCVASHATHFLCHGFACHTDVLCFVHGAVIFCQWWLLQSFCSASKKMKKALCAATTARYSGSFGWLQYWHSGNSQWWLHPEACGKGIGSFMLLWGAEALLCVVVMAAQKMTSKWLYSSCVDINCCTSLQVQWPQLVDVCCGGAVLHWKMLQQWQWCCWLGCGSDIVMASVFACGGNACCHCLQQCCACLQSEMASSPGSAWKLCGSIAMVMVHNTMQWQQWQSYLLGCHGEKINQFCLGSRKVPTCCTSCVVGVNVCIQLLLCLQKV